jgi:hypothetical protein
MNSGPLRDIWFRFKQHSSLYKAGVYASHRMPALYNAWTAIRSRTANAHFPPEFHVLQTDYRLQPKNGWIITHRLLEQLKEDVYREGSDLLIFYVPSAAAVDQEYWKELKHRYRLSDEGWNPRQVGSELLNICDRLDITCLDPTMEFQAAAAKMRERGKLMYFRHDGHWTAEGHSMAGELLAEFVAERYINRGERPPRSPHTGSAGTPSRRGRVDPKDLKSSAVSRGRPHWRGRTGRTWS